MTIHDLSRNTSNPDVALAMNFALKLREGKPFDEHTFAESYAELRLEGAIESEAVSAMWRTHLWSRLRHVLVNEFLAAAKIQRALVKLLLRVWSK